MKNGNQNFKADLHIHTYHSKDSLSKPGEILAAAAEKGLSAVAITDHDEIAGALETRERAAEKGIPLQVIVGEEVTSDEGDILVYFLKRKIKPAPLNAVLKEAQKQRAVCCAAHPYDFARHGINLPALAPAVLSKINAIEAFNARVSLPSHNAAALSFAKIHEKAILAGSDAHHPSETGAAFVGFEGVKELDARSLLFAPRRIGGSISPAFVHAFSRYAFLKKKAASLLKAQR